MNVAGEMNWKSIPKVCSQLGHFIDFIIEVIKSKGIENITVEELVKDITPKGRG